MTSQHKDLTSQHKDLTSQHYYLTSYGRNMPPYLALQLTLDSVTGRSTEFLLMNSLCNHISWQTYLVNTV